MRVRMTLRRSMSLVALVALGLFAYAEFQDGSPPRFVVRGIPDRIARLRPGMTYEEAEEVLGLGKSWLRGGLSASWVMADLDGCFIFAVWKIGSGPPVLETAVGMPPVHFAVGYLEVSLDFTTNAGIREDWKLSKTTRLSGASFRVDGKVVAEMRR